MSRAGISGGFGRETMFYVLSKTGKIRQCLGSRSRALSPNNAQFGESHPRACLPGFPPEYKKNFRKNSKNRSLPRLRHGASIGSSPGEGEVIPGDRGANNLRLFSSANSGGNREESPKNKSPQEGE